MKFEGDDRPPPGWRRIAELSWLAPRLLRGFGTVGPHGPEDGPPALVLPGFMAGDRTCIQLRRALGQGGWRAHPWGLGLNKGVQPDMLRKLEACLDRMSAKEPVLLVGWSLGGIYARELARHCPDRVRAVVTLGAPFSGDLHQNNVWRIYELVAGHAVDDPPIPRITDKPPVPSLAIWSRRDGIIAPRAARGLEDESDKAVEIGCNHMAFGVSAKAGREVVREIRNFLTEIEIPERGTTNRSGRGNGVFPN